MAGVASAQLERHYFDFDPAVVKGAPVTAVGDAVKPGKILTDPQTLENLGVRWLIEGDANRNATVQVAWREKGSEVWKEAQPLLRVGEEIVRRFHEVRAAKNIDRWLHYRVGNLFAGTIFSLKPGTVYEVRLTLADPDGGAPAEPQIVQLSTRKLPERWEGGRRLTVRAAGDKATSGPDSFATVAEAYAAAGPGDIILLAKGTHLFTEPLVITKSGTAERPIVFRGESPTESIIEGAGEHATDLFVLSGASHITFEDLSMRKARVVISTLATDTTPDEDIVIRNCRITDMVRGVVTTKTNSRSWIIADNEIIGFNPSWYPRPNDGTYMAGSAIGVSIYGQGHVVCFNRISRFGDCLAIATKGDPSEKTDEQCVNIDFHNNDLSAGTDDTCETDYGSHNIRVYENLAYNTHTAYSAQPIYGGPVYFIRNIAFGITKISFKWNVHPAGLIAWHNTLVSAETAFTTPQWSNGHLFNNLFLGNTRLINAGTFTPEISRMDYNGYRGGEVKDPISWMSGREDRRFYPTLAEFAKATGYETHGRMVDFSIFQNAAPAELGKSYIPSEVDFRLTAANVAVDAGIPLPNINEGFSGAAPDLGAIEAGAPMFPVGPRQAAGGVVARSSKP